MKNNKIFKAATFLLALTLITSSFAGSTFAKYVTSTTGTDTARVAYWGFDSANTGITFTNLFSTEYLNSDGVKTVDGSSDVIAPGTSGSADFEFQFEKYTALNIEAPEVAYTLLVDTTGSSIGDAIKNNGNIQWKLDSGDWGTWDDLILAINGLDGNVEENSTNKTPENYQEANSLRDAFKPGTVHTVAWQWLIGDGTTAEADTAVGNASTLADVTLKITITANQFKAVPKY